MESALIAAAIIALNHKGEFYDLVRFHFIIQEENPVAKELRRSEGAGADFIARLLGHRTLARSHFGQQHESPNYARQHALGWRCRGAGGLWPVAVEL
jgi:hypothetical protein